MGYLRILCYLLCAAFLAPFAALVVSALTAVDLSQWSIHAVELKSAARSVWAGISSAVAALALGAALAYQVTFRSFPLKRFVEKTLVLPLLFPTFVIGAVYKELFAVSGTLARTFGLPPALTFDFQTDSGFVFVMSLGLMPYVYLLSRISFQSHGRGFLEVGQSAGLSVARSFTKIMLPYAMPAIALCGSLVFVETAGEWATAKLLSVNTGATAVHELWFAREAPNLASQLAFVLTLVALVIVAPSTRSAGIQSARYLAAIPSGPTRDAPVKAASAGRWLRFCLCFLPGLLGFIVPASAVIYYFVGTVGKIDLSELLANSVNTLGLLFAVLCMTGVFATLLSVTHRFSPTFLTGFALRWLTVSYAVPAMVLAVGVMTLVDKALIFDERYWDLVSFLVLAAAMSIRFACFLFIPLYLGLSLVSKQVEEIGGSLGLAKTKSFFRLHVPLTRRFALFGLLLLSLQVIKETSISVALHPFSFETLVLKAYAYIDIGLLPESSAWILATALLGLYPLVTIESMMLKGREARS